MKRYQHIYKKVWRDSRGYDVPKGWHIHHIDGNPSNNHPDNLMACTREEHRAIHTALYEKYGKPRDYFAAQRLGGINYKHPGHTEDAKRRISEARKKAGANMGKSVKCLDTGKVYKTITECSKEKGINYWTLYNSLTRAKKNKFNITFI